MAEKFNLTAQLQLQAPRNTQQIAQQIQRDLSSAGNVKIKTDARGISKATSEMQRLSRATKQASKSGRELDKVIGESARRFAVITFATGTVLGLANALKKSTKEAIEFERELNKIGQVTGKTVGQVNELADKVDKLSTGLGVSASSLIKVSRTLLQTGLELKKVEKIVDVLAKTDLGATFGSLEDTTEGAIALLRQFGAEVRRAGSEAAFLEKALDSINAVSKRFAVESADIVTAIRKTGGVFASAGGEVNELIALFTSVRATTRESADTIATGLRTIFTRIQRAETVNQLKDLGIQLQDSQGRFVGAYKAFELLSKGLRGLDPRDYRFAEIVESLGGFRQVGKVIPLIQQFRTSQEALNVAINASGSVSKDAEKAQDTLANRIDKTKQSFDSLLRSFVGSNTFQSVAKSVIGLADAFLKVFNALEPLIPLLTTLVSLKVGRSLAGIAKSFAGIGGSGSFGRVPRFANGGKVLGFNKGGIVPGTGNRDTVPAMLTPGEFVIKKSSVAQLGSDQLQAMNANRFNDGGRAKSGLRLPVKGGKNKKTDQSKLVTYTINPGAAGVFFLDNKYKGGGTNRSIDTTMDARKVASLTSVATADALGLRDKDRARFDFDIATAGIGEKPREIVGKSIRSGFSQVVENASLQLADTLSIPPLVRSNEKSASKAARSRITEEQLRNIEGSMIEAIVASTTGTALGAEGAFLDLPRISGQVLSRLSKMFNIGKNAIAAGDIKRSLSSDTFGKAAKGSMLSKMINVVSGLGETSPGQLGTRRSVKAKKLNSGGSAGKGSPQDTIPALLTPGEFVINKDAASRIGSANLNMMNKHGVARFNKGGQVGPKRFYIGGSVKKNNFPTGAGMGIGPSAGIFQFGGVVADIVRIEEALKKLGAISSLTSSELLEMEKTLRNGATAAEVFDKTMKKIVDSSNEAKRALEQEAKQKRQVAKDILKNPGNQAATDSRLGSVARAGTGPIKAFDKGGLSSAGLKNVVAQDASVRKQLADIQKQEIRSIAKEIRAIDGNVTVMESLRRAQNQVRNVYGFLEREVKETEKGLNVFQKALQGAKNGMSSIKQAGATLRAKVGGAAQSLQPIASTGQSVAFLGTMITGLIGTMGLFDDKTSELVTQTAAFGTTLLFLTSTLIDVAATIASTTAIAVETTARTGSTLAIGQEVAARQASTVGMTFGTKVFGGLLVVVGLVATAMFYFNQKAKQAAEELSKINNKSLEEIGETGQVSSSFRERAAAGVDANIADLKQQQRQASNNSRQGVSTGLGAAQAEALNAQIEYNKNLKPILLAQIDAYGESVSSLRSLTGDLDTIRKAGFSPEETRRREVERLKQSGNDFTRDDSVGTKAGSQQLDAIAANAGLSRSELLSKTDDELSKLVKNTDFTESEKLQVQAVKLQREANDKRRKTYQQEINNVRLSAETTAEREKLTNLLISAEEEQLRNRKRRGKADGSLTDEQAEELTKAQQERAKSYREADAQFAQSQARVKAADDAYVAAVIASAEGARQSAVFWNGINSRLAAQQNTLQNIDTQQQVAGDNFSKSQVSFDASGGVNAFSGRGRKPASFREFRNRRRDLDKRRESSNQISQIGLQGIKASGLGIASNLGQAAVLGAVGFNESDIANKYGEEAAKKMKAAILKEFDESKTGEIDFDKIYEPLEEATGKSAEKVEAEVREMNGELDIAAAKFGLAAEKIATLNAGFDVLFDTQSRVAEINARATGGSAAKENIRISDARAQNRLNLNFAQRGGVGLQAGNLQNLQAAKKDAFVRQSQAEVALSQGGSQAAYDQAMRETTQTIKDVDAELERMAAGTARVAELEERLAKAQAAREQGKGVIEDFVIGGEDSRRALQSGAAGIMSAMATGTTQNLSEDQRAQTFALLDRLKDVPNLFGGKESGKQLKDRIIQQDAVRLGFDPKVVEALYSGTTVEQNILAELEQQTDQMLTAADLRAWRPAGIVPNNQQQQNQQQGPPVAPNPNNVNLGPLSGNNSSQTNAAQQQNAPDANPYQLDPSAVGNTPTQQQQAQQQQAQQQQAQAQARKPGRNTIAGVDAQMAEIQDRYKYATPGSGYDREDTARMAKLKKKKENLERAQAAREAKKRETENRQSRKARERLANSPLGQIAGNIPNLLKGPEKSATQINREQVIAKNKAAKDDALARKSSPVVIDPNEPSAAEKREKYVNRVTSDAQDFIDANDARLAETDIEGRERNLQQNILSTLEVQRNRRGFQVANGFVPKEFRPGGAPQYAARMSTAGSGLDSGRTVSPLEAYTNIQNSKRPMDQRLRDREQQSSRRRRATQGDEFNQFLNEFGLGSVMGSPDDYAVSDSLKAEIAADTAARNSGESIIGSYKERQRRANQPFGPQESRRATKGSGLYNVTESPIGFNKADSAYGGNRGSVLAGMMGDNPNSRATMEQTISNAYSPRAGTAETINGENTTQSEQNPFAKFSEGLNNIVTEFSSVTSALTQLSSTFQDGIQINHNFSGDMTLALNIQNSEALKAAFGEAITPKIKELIQELMGDKTGGSSVNTTG